MVQRNIKIISDLVCPWAYIARMRLERVLQKTQISARIHWLPYQVSPLKSPQDAAHERTHNRTVFASFATPHINKKCARCAKDLGLHFSSTWLYNSLPHTFDAHRLVWFAEEQDLGDDAARGIFSAYFEYGLDIANTDILIRIGKDIGLEEEQLKALYNSAQGVKEVKFLCDYVRSQELGCLPYMIIDNRFGISGMQSEIKIRNTLLKAQTLDEPSATLALRS